MTSRTIQRPAAVSRRSLQPLRAIDGFRIRLAVGQRTDIEVACRYRYAKLEAEVTERLRSL